MINQILSINPRQAGPPKRALWGVGWGAIFGVIFSVVAVGEVMLQGERVLARSGLGLGMVLAVYMTASPIAGMLVGLLLPIARWKTGRMALGIIAVLCIGLAIRLAGMGDRSWNQLDTVVVVAGALSIGIPTGLIYREMFSMSTTKGAGVDRS